MSNFGEILAEFKKLANNEAENIFPIMDDDTLTNGLIAWKSVKIKFKPLADCNKKEDSEKWEWLWDNIEFDMGSFGIVAGVKTQDAFGLFTRLKGFRLIYPDGTINLLAKQFLQAKILSQIKPRKAEKPIPEAKKE